MNRLHYLIIFFVVLLIAAYSNWLLTTFRPDKLTGPRPVRHDPDYFIEGVTATVMQVGGQPRYRLRSQRIEHYPDDHSLALTEPRADYFRPDLPAWHLRAERGRIYDRGERVFLDGAVFMNRPADRKRPAAELETRDLELLPQQEYAETAARARLRLGRNTLAGTGMQLFLKQGRLELLADGEGTYVPR
jgi:lipopolysaccharide export system protein LptC